MKKSTRNTVVQQQMNDMGKNGIPFLFLIDYEMEKSVVYPLSEVPYNLSYNLNGITNHRNYNQQPIDFTFDKMPISSAKYKKGFDLVTSEIRKGNSFLLNLSYPTKVSTSLSISDIFDHSIAPYKVSMKDEWVCFSPESFVKIEDGHILSFPMKGTIDASIPQAEKVILSDVKEKAEHNTIIDLIRNDLSRVAKKVSVNRYRYIDRIKTNDKEILQVSSEIKGVLPDNYMEKLGDIFYALIPAGSISGAPKKKTLEIIRKAEGIDRGFYTGIIGIFDGQKVDSGVMIRFIEKKECDLYYRSGGGITHLSKVEEEYNELIDKVYVPIYRKHPNCEWASDEHKVPQPAL